jgi:urease accessory protein
MKATTGIGALAALLLSTMAQAHTFGASGGGLAQGFAHPFLGLDHLLAMLAVGLWAAQLGGRARWAVPATFVAMMAAGGLLALAGVALPRVEAGIAASVLVLGLLITTASRLPTWVGAIVVGTFAVFHGHAHGTELPMQASEIAYGVGMLSASALLHGLGLGLAWMAHRGGVVAQRGLRVAGVAIAAAGGLLLLGAL